MTVAGGRVVSRPMNGAIEGMLAVLEDPRAEQADAAVAGLVERYYREGPDVLRPYKPRFRKMLVRPRPGRPPRRRLGAGPHRRPGRRPAAHRRRSTDPDEDVVDAARLGLQIISRKIEGLGPPSPSTPEQRKEAAARWREWYNAIRPLDLDDEDEDPGPPAARPEPSPAPPAGGRRGARSHEHRRSYPSRRTHETVDAPPEARGLGRHGRADGPRRVAVRPGHVVPDGDVLGAILVVGWLALVYVSNQAFAVARDRAAADHRRRRRGRRQSRRDARLDREDRRRRRGRLGVRLEQRGGGGRLRGAVRPADPGRDARRGLRGRREPGRGRHRRRHAQRRAGRHAASASSKLGTGGPGLGFGPGDGGVSREQRWSIIYKDRPDRRGIRPAARRPPRRDGRRHRTEPARVCLQLLQPAADQAVRLGPEGQPPLFPLARIGAEGHRTWHC